MVIEVDALAKHFRVHRRAPGLAAAARGLLRRRYDVVRAVDGISFGISAGEVVGFLGPNGAGKTTTLKCLAGLLHPSGGTVRVLDAVPAQRERAYLSRIALVVGQRNSMFWDLPAMESFLVNKAIYRIHERAFRAALDELVTLLALAPLLDKQVRTLSLGERMRCELAAGLLHRPDVLFLDEPTLGLDVEGQAAVRQFLADYTGRHGATLLLTSHYMGDVTALAQRVLVIDSGRLRHDGNLRALVEATAPYRLVRLTFASPVPPHVLAAYGEAHEVSDGTTAVLRVPRGATRDAAARLLAELPVLDLGIEEPPVEDIIRQVFSGA